MGVKKPVIHRSVFAVPDRLNFRQYRHAEPENKPAHDHLQKKLLCH